MAGTASTFTLKSNDGITTLVEQSVDTDESIVLDNGIIKFIDSSSVETTLYDLITNDYAGLSTTQGATTIDSGYGLDTTITLVNGGDQLGYTFYVVEQQEQDIAISLDNLTRYHNNLKVVLENLRLVAEGKCKALVISYLDTYSAIVSYLTDNPTKKVYLKSSGEDITNAFISGTGGLDQAISNPSFNTNDLSIPANIQGSPNLYFAAVKDENGDYYLYSLNNTIGADLNTGDLILVVETDVPDRWYDDTGYLYALETTKVDLSNYPTLSGNNTFSGTNTFVNFIDIKRSATASNGFQFLYSAVNNELCLLFNYGNRLCFDVAGGFYPYIDENSSIGKYNKRYLSVFTESIKNNNATYGITIPDMSSWTANKEIATTDNIGFLNIDEPSSTTLTDDQIAEIIKGAVILDNVSFFNSDYISIVFFPASNETSAYNGVCCCQRREYSQLHIKRYTINKSTKVISFESTAGMILSGGFVNTINGVSYNEYYKKPQLSVSLSDGGTITNSTLKTLIQNEQPIKLNGFTCYFSCDDGTNYQYTSIRYDANANQNHINVITINKSTWVATFHTSDIALN